MSASERASGPMAAPRPLSGGDLAWVLALNRIHERELSPLGPEDLAALVERAAIARVVDPNAAFLLAFDEKADYASPNFRWFQQRERRFIYVDRIAVDIAFRGRGLARALYDDLFRAARALAHDRIVCEVNSDPPNPASDALHAALGFEPVGEALLADRGKQVRYLCRQL